MPRPNPHRRDRTRPLIWLLAAICAALAVAVIIACILVFAIYLIFHPKTPSIRITYAHLNNLSYGPGGLLSVEIAITIAAENGNGKAAAAFYDANFVLRFHGVEAAVLTAAPFEVPNNSSSSLGYVVKSSAVPLDGYAVEEMDKAMKKEKVYFSLSGQIRARWRMGVFFYVKSLLHISCQLLFVLSNGSSVEGVGCSS